MNKRRVVPAQPGFDLIMPHRTERSGFECHPIVAWKIVLLGENATTTIPVVGSHRVATYRAGTGIVKYRRPVSDHANITASATMSTTIALTSADPSSLIGHMAPAAYGAGSLGKLSPYQTSRPLNPGNSFAGNSACNSGASRT